MTSGHVRQACQAAKHRHHHLLQEADMWRVVVARPEDNGTLLSSELPLPPPPPPPPPPTMHHQPPPPSLSSQHHHHHHWPPPPVSYPPYPPHRGYPAHEQQQQQPESQEATPQQTRSLKRPLSDSDCDDVFSEESGKEPCNSPGADSCQHTSRKRRRGMIEKKRRDRINASLGELRRLVPAAARDPHSGKLEKAEILQLTVEYLRTLRVKGAEGYDSTKLAMDYHAVGWGECVAEVGRYLVTMEGLDERDPLRLRLLSHLQSFHREQQQQQQQQQPPPQTASQQQQQQQHPQQQAGGYEQSTSSSLQVPLAWPAAQYPGPGQYPTAAQYGQQQHGKPYRPWGAELAY